MRRLLIVLAVLVATAGIFAYLALAAIPIDERYFALGWVAWAPVGGFVLWRRPGNGVARALIWVGLSWGVAFWAYLLAASELPLEIRVWSDLVGVILGVVPWLGIVWLILVFPSGRLDGTLERVAGACLLVVSGLAIFSFTVTTDSMGGPTGLPSPLASPSLERAVSWVVSESGFAIIPALVVLAIVSMARRWARSSGVERHQYRWLLLGAVVFVIILGVGQVVPDFDDGVVLWTLSGSAIPLVVGVAVTRYRLYEIDRVISRTVTYGLVVAAIAGAVAALAASIGSLFQSPWVVAATTLGVAALFNPLRRRVQVWVDRRFNRSHYDAELVMDQFAASLRDRVDSDAVVDGWLGVIDETMQPGSVGVWVRP